LNAIRTLIVWSGVDLDRDDLLDKLNHVAQAYEDFFDDFKENSHTILAKNFDNISSYNEMIIL
jgi:GTP cyclohydrolase I